MLTACQVVLVEP